MPAPSPRDPSTTLYELLVESQQRAREFVAQIVDAFAAMRVGGSELARLPLEVLLDRPLPMRDGPARVYVNSTALHIATILGLSFGFERELTSSDLPDAARLALHLGAEFLEG